MSQESHCKWYTDRDRLCVELMTRLNMSIDEQAARLGRTPRAIYEYQRAAGIVPVRTPRAPVCTIEGCTGDHHARGYCTLHYARWQRRQGTR